MPKRKKSRKNQTSRMRPKLPEGDLDTSMSIDERKAKLDVYLKDFNTQEKLCSASAKKNFRLEVVEERLAKMKARGCDMIFKVKGAYSLEMLKLPLEIRKMKLNDYLVNGGRVNDAAFSEASDLVSQMTKSFLNPLDPAARAPLAELRNLPPKTPGVSNVKKEFQGVALSASKTEFQEQSTVPRSLRPRKRKDASPCTVERNTRTKNLKAQNSSMCAVPPSTGKRTSRRIQSKAQFVTPASHAGNYSFTPLVTPKFDPRLPLTPAMLREPKAGERIMSLSGSPIVNHGPVASYPQVVIPLADGRTFHLNTDSHLSPSQAPGLSDAARKNVELLQAKLAQLLVLPPHGQRK